MTLPVPANYRGEYRRGEAYRVGDIIWVRDQSTTANGFYEALADHISTWDESPWSAGSRLWKRIRDVDGNPV